MKEKQSEVGGDKGLGRMTMVSCKKLTHWRNSCSERLDNLGEQA